MKARKIDFLEHVERTDANRMPQKILYEKIYAKRVRGRTKLRSFDDVREDLRILKVKDLRSTVRDRNAWRLFVQEAKAHKGLWYGMVWNLKENRIEYYGLG
jgi:hypothetical protein